MTKYILWANFVNAKHPISTIAQVFNAHLEKVAAEKLEQKINAILTVIKKENINSTAGKTLETITNKAGYTPWIYFVAGCAAIDANDLKTAEDFVRAYLREIKTDPRAHYILGYIQIKQKKYGMAENHFAQTINLAKDHPDGYFGLGVAQFFHGEMLLSTNGLEAEEKYEAAQRNLRTYVALADKDPAGHYHLSQVLHALGKYEESEEQQRMYEILSKNTNDTKH